MTSQWFKAGPRANWRGRIELVDGHTRIWHKHWPNVTQDDIDARPITRTELAYNINTDWWLPVDTDLDMDEGL